MLESSNSERKSHTVCCHLVSFFKRQEKNQKKTFNVFVTSNEKKQNNFFSFVLLPTNKTFLFCFAQVANLLAEKKQNVHYSSKDVFSSKWAKKKLLEPFFLLMQHFLPGQNCCIKCSESCFDSQCQSKKSEVVWKLKRGFNHFTFWKPTKFSACWNLVVLKEKVTLVIFLQTIVLFAGI